MNEIKFLISALFFAVCITLAGCSKNEETPPEVSPDMPIAKKSTPSRAEKLVPKPATKPVAPTTRKVSPAPLPKPKLAYTWGTPFKEKDAEGHMQICVSITNNLAVKLRLNVTFVFTRDKEGKDVIQRFSLPEPVELEANEQTKVRVSSDKIEPVGQYWCSAFVETIK